MKVERKIPNCFSNLLGIPSATPVATSSVDTFATKANPFCRRKLIMLLLAACSCAASVTLSPTNVIPPARHDKSSVSFPAAAAGTLGHLIGGANDSGQVVASDTGGNGSNESAPNWQPLKNQPTFVASSALLLTDGTVICQAYQSSGWYKSTPDSHVDERKVRVGPGRMEV